MIIKKAEFITSVAHEKDFLSFDKPVIAVAGKSNVGKSSFINMLANQNKLAKTSNTPGRTRLINYFDFGEFVLADLPGYGFAKVSKSEKDKWARLMERYFETSKIANVFLLLDVRHKPTAEDVQMINYLYHYALPFTLIATKVDKLGKSKIKPELKNLANYLKVGEQNVLGTSATSRYGKENVLDRIENIIKVFAEGEYVEEE
ncbi:MAG: YihA family ribosome biogenesis GTP-binding protein [Clostridiales bacterium]|nr:YihA family ribosome biogenesis GTP-binding protein [Clostridiales bacterium]